LLTLSVANAQFTTVYNLPPDVLPVNEFDNFVPVGATQVNLLDGGTLANDFVPSTLAFMTELNVLGGAVEADVYEIGRVNVSGGILSAVTSKLGAITE
jgi:hypothetical protein